MNGRVFGLFFSLVKRNLLSGLHRLMKIIRDGCNQQEKNGNNIVNYINI
jgi:hypothetical protein